MKPINNSNSIQQSNEMLLYNTFKFYFEIDLENNIMPIDNAKNSLNTFLNNDNNDYIQILQENITQENLKTLKSSKEYLTLLHIQYLGENEQVFGKGFQQALKEKSHLKLWYEIRYNSNSKNDKGIAIKRFKQSNLFGLYENNDINDKIFQSLCDNVQIKTKDLNQDKVSLNESMIFFEFLNIAESSKSQTYYESIIKKEEEIKKNFTDNSFPLSQSLVSITQPFLNTMKQYYIQENNPSLKIESIYIIQKSKDKPNVTDNIATINKRMQQNNSSFFIFYPQSIGDIALQIRQKFNSTLYLIVCKDTKIDCTYLGTHSRLYLSDFKDKQSTNYFLGTEIKNDTESAQEPTLSQKDDYLELDKNGDDIADYQQEYIFKNAEPILTIQKHQSNILLYNTGFSKQNHIISNEINKNQKVNKLGIKLKLKEEKSHSTDCSKEGNFTLYINELYIYCSNQHSSIQHNHNNETNSNESNNSIQDSHNSQGQPIIYLLNCENRKTYQINLQENKDNNGNTKTDKAGNISYSATLSTELNLDDTPLANVTTKLILSCNDLVTQNYSTYDIHKITGVGIISVNNQIKKQAKAGKGITYKNILHLKQTTTLDEKIDNTDSILEVRINNIQKPIKIDTALECEAIYYGYNLVKWAYMILPTKDYNPNKTGLIKDEHYYELPSDTYKGNIITFNPKEYLQSLQSHQTSSQSPNSKAQTNNSQPSSNSQTTNPPNYSQQLQHLTQGDYTLVIFAYLRSPAYKARNYTTHTKLDYKPPLSLQFNGKELQILEWGEVKRDKSFKLNPLNLSNPKAFITESKDYQIKLDTIPMIIRPRDSYMLNITDTHNSNQATITNTNTQNIINPEIFIDDDFCKLIHILQQYKNQYKASEVKLEVGYENISNYYVDSEGYIQGAGFKLPTDSKGNDVKINLANFIEHGEIGKIRAIILHRTMSKSAQSSIDWWQNHKAKGAGTHFMIDKDGTIYQCATLYKTTWHVGARKKGITITNNTSIGIEVVAWYDDKTHKWDEATREQKIALRKIIKILLKHYNLTENDIYEHDKIANKTAGEGANLYIKGEK
ncbi:N-acetylmuramoyl-L-alanine amidase [Helicobacter cinaedi]|uniref:peptidoglycan recognition protein family protein n=1 Tax=Helicobacter cinaedi TaxID=213 RepID=UPI0018A5F5DB|nr:peptidoglycan recognition family protein [Helicobacter cinaedi]QOQ95428.1 N-acetylmuramoyl-L-alanine amidase [Helicobacter cinaedi]